MGVVKTFKLDRMDKEILRNVILRGREGIRALARELGKSPSTVSERLKRLERIGVIRGYTAIIDYSAIGYEVNAITLIQVEGEKIEEIEEMLAKQPNVRGVFDITGEYDIALIISFKSVRDLDKFIKNLIRNPYIKRSMTSLIFRVIKDTPHVEEFLKKKE